MEEQITKAALAAEATRVALVAERDYVDGQLDVLHETIKRMDKASEVLHETVTRVPTEMQLAIGHMKELVDVEFKSIALQFKERDTRSERESRDNKVAVDAAFAAQKEAASEQNKSNTLAIAKSEAATAETIKTMQEANQSSSKSLSDKIDDLKERIARTEFVKLGGEQVTTNTRQNTALFVSLGMLAVAVFFGAIGLIITLI